MSDCSINIASAVRRVFAILCISLVSVQLANAQGSDEGANEPRRVTRITIADGLSQSSVYTMMQDERGFVWIGTGGGIDITNGVSFRRLRHDPTSDDTLSDNYVRKLHPAGDGDVWIGTDGGGLNRYHSETGRIERFPLTVDVGGDRPARMQHVFDLHTAPNGALWIGSDDGIFLHQPGTGEFRRPTPAGPVAWPSGTIREIMQRGDGSIWIGTASEGVYSLAFDGAPLVHRSGTDAPSITGTMINCIVEDSAGRLWIGTETEGISRLDDASGTFIRIGQSAAEAERLGDSDVTSVVEDAAGHLWMGTWSSGLVRYDPLAGTFEDFSTSAVDQRTLSSNTVISTMIDRSGTLWAGTFDNGANRLQPLPGPFVHYPHDPLTRTGPNGRMIWSFAEGDDGAIWVGSKTGISRFDPATGRFEWLDADAEIFGTTGSVDTRALLQLDRTLWIGTFGGLVAHDLDSGATRTYRHDANDPSSLPSDKVRLLLARDDGLWVGTQNGLARLDIATGRFTRLPHGNVEAGELPHHRVRALAQDRTGALWVGTSGGLSVRDDATGRFRTWTSETSGLPDDDVRAIVDLGPQGLWVGTGKGIARLDPKTGLFDEPIVVAQGLANPTVYAMLHERTPEGAQLWITTNNGVSRFEVGTGSFSNFVYRDGLQSNEFNFNAALRASNGRLWLGGVNGVSVVHPDRLRDGGPPPLLDIARTGNTVGDRDRTLGHPGTALAPNDEVRRPHGANSIELVASALHYRAPQRNQLRFRVPGLDEEWNVLRGATATIRYDDLASRRTNVFGDQRYGLEVQAVSSAGVASAMREIPITIAAPWWRKPLPLGALTLGAFAVAGLAATFVQRLYVSNLALRTQRGIDGKRIDEQQKSLASQNAEIRRLLDARTQFYRKASHEIRTPLALMRGPLDSIRASADRPPDPRILRVLDRNLERLQRLSNGMLALENLAVPADDGELPVVRPTAFLSPIVDAFATRAQELGITIRFGTQPEGALSIDAEALEDIVYVLLSNALRHCRAGDTVLISSRIEESMLRLVVRDDGPGFPSQPVGDDGQDSFDADGDMRAAARELGLGLGLGHTIASERAVAVGGSFEIEPVDRGTCFVVRLPCLVVADAPSEDGTNLNGAVAEATSRRAEASNDARPTAPGARPPRKPRLLLVEDEADMVEYLTLSLTEDWSVEHRVTLADALAALRAEEFALVLCDVMLPDGTGFEFAKALRDDLLTSHVPLVFLSALADRESEATGLGLQADDYITKPFDIANVRTRLRNIRANQATRAERTRKAVLKETNGTQQFTVDPPYAEQRTEVDKRDINTLGAPDRAFLVRINDICEEHLADAEFGIATLASEAGVGEQTLRRKVRALLGITPKEFILRKRIQKAKRLLREGATIKAVAFDVGYRDPSHFSRLFRAETGQSPRSYKKDGGQKREPEGVNEIGT